MRLLAIFLLVTGCSAIDRTNRETVLARYVDSSDTLAFLIMSPAECFACTNAIGDLMRWEREAPHRRLLTLLTRQPTAIERAQLTIMRFRVTVVLDVAPAQSSEPLVLMVTHGEVLDSARGQKALLAIVSKFTHAKK